MNNSIQNIVKPSLWHIYRLEAKAEWLKLLRTPGFSLPTLFFPVMFYLFFGVLFSNGSQMPTYLLATYGTFGVMGPALFAFGVGIALERGQGWFEVKQISPMPASAYLLARIASCLCFSMVIVLLLFAVAALFGDVRLLRNDWLSLALILVAGSIPFCAIGLTLGLLLNPGSAPAVVNLIYLPMAFLSGLWMPVTFFSETLQNLANLLPAYHLSQLALKVVALDQGQSLWLHIGILGGYLVGFAWLAMRAYQRQGGK